MIPSRSGNDLVQDPSRIGRRAFEGIQSGEAHVCATDCPLAATQFRQHANMDALHPMTILARAYREQGKNRKEVVLKLGKLSDPEADRWRKLLAEVKKPNSFVTTLDDLDSLASLGAAGAVLGMALYTEQLDPLTVAERYGAAQDRSS